MSKPSTLESRIATALTATDIKSSNLATLIAETEAAITTADKIAEEERTKALDPIASPDATKAREAMQAAEFNRDRLRTVLPRLQAKHKEVKEQEHAAAWTADYAAVKARRDAAAEQLRERYPTIVAELVALMADIAATDREVDRVNVAAPYGDYPRLRGVELTARGLDRLLQPDISIVQELRLPCFDRAPGMPLMAYPLPQPNFAVEFVNLIPPDTFDWRNWHEEFEKRDRRALEENRRQIAEAEAQLRAHEEREAAEARKAKEADQVAVGRWEIADGYSPRPAPHSTALHPGDALQFVRSADAHCHRPAFPASQAAAGAAQA